MVSCISHERPLVRYAKKEPLKIVNVFEKIEYQMMSWAWQGQVEPNRFIMKLTKDENRGKIISIIKDGDPTQLLQKICRLRLFITESKEDYDRFLKYLPSSRLTKNPDQQVYFFSEMRQDPEFAKMFLETLEPKCAKPIETIFNKFRRAKSITFYDIEAINQEDRIQRYLLKTLCDLLETYMVAGANPMQIKSAVTRLKQAFPWITLDLIKAIDEQNLVYDEFLLHEVLQSLSKNDVPQDLMKELLEKVAVTLSVPFLKVLSVIHTKEQLMHLLKLVQKFEESKRIKFFAFIETKLNGYKKIKPATIKECFRKVQMSSEATES